MLENSLATLVRSLYVQYLPYFNTPTLALYRFRSGSLSSLLIYVLSSNILDSNTRSKIGFSIQIIKTRRSKSSGLVLLWSGLPEVCCRLDCSRII